VQLLDGLLVVSEILLAADENDGKALAEVQDLRNPLETKNNTLAHRHQEPAVAAFRGERKKSYLLLDVVKGVWGVDSEADKDDVRVGV
jgi:hypothetical protein